MENYNIIYEDNQVIVVVKPQNMPAQADSSGDMDLLTALKEYIKVKYNKPGDAYLGLVHRLDRPTGGVMVFARTSKSAARISAAIKEGEIDKKYLLIVVGEPRVKQDRLTHYLLKNPTKNTVMTVPQATDGAKKAVLQYKTLETKRGVSLVEIVLETGRSHQIRVQMQAIGTPVFGDVRYGGDTLAKGHNLALWAYELKFNHPVTNKRLVFRVFPPVDMVPWNVFDIDKHLNIHKPE